MRNTPTSLLGSGLTCSPLGADFVGPCASISIGCRGALGESRMLYMTIPPKAAREISPATNAMNPKPEGSLP